MTFLILLLLAADPATAAVADGINEATVADLDGGRHVGKIVSLDGQTLVVESGADNERTSLPTAEILEIDFGRAVDPSSSTLLVGLRGGGLLRARDIACGEEEADITLADDSRIRLGVDVMDGLLWGQADGPRVDRWRRQVALPRSIDLLVAARGDQEARLEGIIGSIDADHLHFTLDGEEIPVRRERVREVHLAHPAPRVDPRAMIHDVLGNVWPAGTLAIAEDLIHWSDDATGARSLSVDEVSRIDLSAGRVVYLSDLEPTVVEHVPYFDQAWEYRRDVNFLGQPLRLGATRFAKGLVVHSKTTLTYDLAPGTRRWMATVGIDSSAGPHGQADARVAVDGEVLWQGFVRSGTPAVAVDVAVPPGKRLTLMVDYGPLADVGDHVVFGNARFIK